MKGGGLAHCTLPLGWVSKPVYNRTVKEIWCFLEGNGQVWRKQGAHEEVVDVNQGIILTIPVCKQTVFQHLTNQKLTNMR